MQNENTFLKRDNILFEKKELRKNTKQMASFFS